MSRYFFYALVGAFIGVVAWFLVASSANGDPIPPPVGESIPEPPSVPASIPATPLEVTILRKRVRLEHARYLQARRRVHQLTRTLQHHTSAREAIDLACVAYGASCSTLWRRARCESGGSPSPRARNSASGAAGLFQFLPSTWLTTPFARFSIWSPYANAFAAAWMETHGRGGEWTCR